jgi:hypothetical protein
MDTLKIFLAGAAMLNALAIALFFLRFWQQTRDRLFAFLGWAFLLMGIERISMVVFTQEVVAWVYLIRLAAFLLILVGIWDKNTLNRRASQTTQPTRPPMQPTS